VIPSRHQPDRVFGTHNRQHFESTIESIRHDGRYRVFTDLERNPERPPYGLWRRAGEPVEIVIWCSKDYLATGRHPLVVEAMASSVRRHGTGAGGTRNIDPVASGSNLTVGAHV